MKSSTTSEFWHCYAGLPPRVKQLARRAYKLWAQDPHHRQQVLDPFIDAIRSIEREAAEDPELVSNAPHTTRTVRLDEVAAAHKPGRR